MRVRGDQSRDQFHTFVKDVLEELRAGLAAATEAREEADDEILQVQPKYSLAVYLDIALTSHLVASRSHFRAIKHSSPQHQQTFWSANRR